LGCPWSSGGLVGQLLEPVGLEHQQGVVPLDVLLEGDVDELGGLAGHDEVVGGETGGLAGGEEVGDA